MKDQPPRLAERLFTLFSGDAFLEDLLGDLHETYLHKLETRGSLWAKAFYWYQAFRLLFSYAITKRKREWSLSSYYPSQKLNIMLLSYIKISVRNISKNKPFALLNIFGLALGMCIGLLALAFYVELHQFDEFHPDAEDIYRITTKVIEEGNKEEYASAPTPLTYLAQEQLTGLEAFVHINDEFFPSIKTAGESIQLQGYFTEPAFFDMFDFTLVNGDKSVLEQPGMVIITHEAAKKLFGDKLAMGQSLQTQHWGQCKWPVFWLPSPKTLISLSIC